MPPQPARGPDPRQRARFDEVYTRHAGMVARSLRLWGVTDGELDDCLQEVFIVTARRLEEIDVGAPLRPWLLGVARNVAKRHHRTRARHSEHDGVPCSPRSDDTPEHDAAARESLQLVETFLAGLKPSYREVFVLSHIEGCTAVEIAELLGTNANTIYTRLMRARAAFQRAVERHESGRTRGMP